MEKGAVPAADLFFRKGLRESENIESLWKGNVSDLLTPGKQNLNFNYVHKNNYGTAIRCTTSADQCLKTLKDSIKYW